MSKAHSSWTRPQNIVKHQTKVTDHSNPPALFHRSWQLPVRQSRRNAKRRNQGRMRRRRPLQRRPKDSAKRPKLRRKSRRRKRKPLWRRRKKKLKLRRKRKKKRRLMPWKRSKEKELRPSSGRYTMIPLILSSVNFYTAIIIINQIIFRVHVRLH